jgi:Family of unknown function (DUF5309)
MTTPAIQDFGFYNTSIPDYLVKSFAGNMIRSRPNGSAPLFALTSMMGKGKALSVIHQYMSKTMVFPSMTMNGAIANVGITTFTVVSTTNVVPGDIFRVDDPTTLAVEHIRVLTVVSATSITVARSVGSVTGNTIGAAAVLYKVGNAFEQGSIRPAPLMMNPTPVQNFTQIFRNSWALARTASVIQAIVGDTLISESRQDAGAFHASDIEKALFFGQKSSTVVNNQQMTTMDGLIERIRTGAPSNFTNAGSTTTYDQLETMLDPLFNTAIEGNNSSERILFVGATARKVINGIGRKTGQYQIIEGSTSFGMQYETVKISRGTFRIMEHPLFNSNPSWAKMAVGVSIPALKLAYLAGVDTVHTGYGDDGRPVDNGIDAVGGTLLTEVTLENINPSAHGVITGLTAAA